MPANATSSAAPRRALKTPDAAQYLGVSPSLLRKMRMRGPDDPLGSGPSFIRLSPSLIVYDIASLDAWLDAIAKRSNQGTRTAA